jgi:aspartate aminotransferase
MATVKREEPRVAARLAKVPQSQMLSLADKVTQMRSSGEKIIDLSLGQPEVPAPRHVSEAMQKSLDNPTASYSSSAGSAELRKLIAGQLEKNSQAETNPEEVIVTAGSKHALFIALLSLIDQEDQVLTFEPYFPPYAEILGLVGGELKTVPVEDRLEPDVDRFLSAINGKTKAVILNFPNNPAGWTLERSDIQKICEYCKQKEIFVISDEIYDHIVFDGRVHCPAWTFSKESTSVIHIGSFSKTYSMVPYRLGFVAARKNIADQILKSQRATVTMVSPYVQSAGIAALSGPQEFISKRLAKYEERRDNCLKMLTDHEIACPKPSGAFYLFIPLPAGRFSDAFGFASRILDERKVAVIPGGVFGERWKNYFRISFATEDVALYDAMHRICEILS